MATRKVARLGDTSTHGGVIITTNTDETVFAEGQPIAVKGAKLQCGNSQHGIVEIVDNVAIKTFVNGKPVVLEGSVATCGAVIIVNQDTVKVE